MSFPTWMMIYTGTGLGLSGLSAVVAASTREAWQSIIAIWCLVGIIGVIHAARVIRRRVRAS